MTRSKRVLTITISIHVPRVEDDAAITFDSSMQAHFNPRPPGGGRRYSRGCYGGTKKNFNPRPPGGGRRDIAAQQVLQKIFQSTSPGWRTTTGQGASCHFQFISIHVPRVEDDDDYIRVSETYEISIHVPRVEDDTPMLNKTINVSYFNPRPPGGGRLSHS